MEYARTERPLSVDERAERLLWHLVDESESLGSEINLSFRSVYAWTESSKSREIAFLIDYLRAQGWVTGARGERTQSLSVTVTFEGHRRVADLSARSDTSQAFVAMWFDDSVVAVYPEGIAPAIRDAGYRPLRIDQKEHNNKIDDEIIAEIRRSRFIVADFTQGDEGARGGVYYEAGFAHGLGLPVIFTCRQDGFDDLHFDTNHYNHIAWSTPEELREKLKNRILAVMNEGPELNRAG